MINWLNFLIDSIAFGAVFIFGSTGEIITEKAGHLNLGIPGIMCMGGAGGCICLQLLGGIKGFPPFLLVLFGTLSAFAMAGLMGLIYSFLTVTLRANQNVTGLAMTTFGSGLMMTLMDQLDPMVYLNKPKNYFRFPFFFMKEDLNKTGLTSCLRVGVLFFVAIAVAIVTSYLLYKTKLGLNLRAVGENPATADAAGINVTKNKYFATCIGAGIAGLGGFYYIVDYMGSMEAYKSIEAFGWLSIALVIFALWKPHMAIVGSIIFGFLFNCSSMLTTMLPNFTLIKSISAKPILKMLPYIVTIIVLVITSIRGKKENQAPASLGLSYFREDR